MNKKDSHPFVSYPRHWEPNRRHVSELRVKPAKSFREDGARIPGVAIFKGPFLMGALTEQEATLYADSIIDALETARDRYPEIRPQLEQTTGHE